MAEPARRLDNDQPGSVYDEPTGTAPSDPRPQLRALEGGGETTDPKRGHLSEAGVSSDDDLASKESAAVGLPRHDSQLGKGYSQDGSLSRFSSLNKFKRRRTLLGGGLLGTIVAIFMLFTFLGGPFEFIHIAQLLEKFHFAGLQSEQDDRFAKEVRLFRYAGKGQVEKTRLGYLSNKFADRFETKLNSTGLESSYSKTFGLFDGYVIDESNEKFKDMSKDDIKQYYKENGINVVDGATIKGADPSIKGKLVIDASNLGYLDNYKLTYGLLQEAGYSKLSSAIGARYLCARAACTSMLHPLTKKVSSGKRSIEDWWNNRTTADEEGSTAPEITTEEDPSTQKDPAKKGSADSVKSETEGDKGLSAKDISAKLSGGAAAVAGVLCVAKGVASDAHNLKASQVQVLTRMAIESMAIGSQLESGQDVNMAQLAQYNDLLSGTDSTGKKTSWDESESIQANLGNSKTGVAPDKTLTTVTNDSTPFDFLNNSQPLATILGGVCSTAGQIITFLGGGIEGLVQTAVLSVVLSQTSFINDLAHWLAGSAIDVGAVGADFGNEIDYGAALAANGQAVLSGGSPLTSTQAAMLRSTTDTIAQEQFDHQSIVHKIFSPYDSQSLISKAIDSSSPSPTQNLAKIGSALLDIKGAFASIGRLFGGQAHAASSGFDYGFPTYGFSQADMTNPAYANPYENACYVIGCSESAGGTGGPIVGFLTDSSQDGAPPTAAGTKYIDEADQCFGAKISQVTIQTDSGPNTQWDVTSGSNNPNPYDSSYPKSCSDSSDKNWVRLRFFIMDTMTMNSMSCYEGDGTACTDVGFSTVSSVSSDSTDTPGVTSGSGAIDEGSSSELAQKILNYRSTGQYNCDNAGDCTDLQKVVNGQSLAGSDGCQAQTLDPRVLKLILYLIESGYKIGTYAMCGDHSFDSSGGHSGGLAVDISSINGLALNQDSPAVAAIGIQMDKFLNNLPSELKLDQQISYGYGNHYYAPMAALQQAQGKLCQDTCVGFYTQAVEDVHTNHIHAGF